MRNIVRYREAKIIRRRSNQMLQPLGCGVDKRVDWPVVPPCEPGAGSERPVSGLSGSPAPGLPGGAPGTGSEGAVLARATRAAGARPAPQSSNIRMRVHNLFCALRRMFPFSCSQFGPTPPRGASKKTRTCGPSIRVGLDTGRSRTRSCGPHSPGSAKGYSRGPIAGKDFVTPQPRRCDSLLPELLAPGRVLDGHTHGRELIT